MFRHARVFAFVGSSLAVLALQLGASRRAFAGGPLTDQGSRIQTSDYGVDLFQGPVLANTRITALGGAFTAISEGTEGIQFNPAAASFRLPYSTTRTDYDLTAGLTLPASVKGTDFDNNNSVGFTYDTFYFATFGGLLQFEKVGFGLLASFQNYELGVPGTPVPLPNSNETIDAVTVRLLKLDPVASYGFLDEQLHIGAGLRLASFYGIGNTNSPAGVSAERILLNSAGVGVQAGALWAPYDLPLRVGGAARSPTLPFESEAGRISANAEGDRIVGNLFLPNRVELPWEVEGGFAIQLWKRPFNLRWTDEDKVPAPETERWRRGLPNGENEAPYLGARRLIKARYAQIPRQRVLLSFSALLTGPVRGSVGFESALSQVVERSGEQAVVTLRGGAESELIPNWLVLRAGSYLEPSRYRTGETRLHGTGGFALRVLRWSVFGLFDEDTLFRVSVAVDGARDYFGWSVGAGFFR